MNDMSFIYSNQRGSGSAVRWRDRDSEQIQEGRSDWLTGDVTACIYSLCFRGNSRQLLLLSKPHQGKCVTGCMSAYVSVCVPTDSCCEKTIMRLSPTVTGDAQKEQTRMLTLFLQYVYYSQCVNACMYT